MPEAADLLAAAARLRHGAERVGHRTCFERADGRSGHGSSAGVKLTTLVAEGTRPGLAAVLSPLATADLPIPPHISPYLSISPHISSRHSRAPVEHIQKRDDVDAACGRYGGDMGR